ncbi:MAG: hypothetical protein E7256_05625 [Lachnospiraceae bacterium]|nr:hypothetical protein [Lachnospiraceae bacterium]
MPEQTFVISEQIGNITSPNASDKVILTGIHPEPGGMFIDDLELTLYPSDNAKPVSLKIPESGIFLQLFLGDFTGDGRSDIMIRGDLGGTGGYAIALIYHYEKGTLKELFNQDRFSQKNTCTAAYQNNYQMLIKCPASSFPIDLSSYSKEYLSMIYTDDKKVKPNISASVSWLNEVFPVKPVSETHYDLILYQRIIGVFEADTIGYIETRLSYQKKEFVPIYKGVLMLSDQVRTASVSSMEFDSNLQNISSTSGLDVYYSQQFKIEPENLDLIINAISEDDNVLYADGYLINLRNTPIRGITNFYLKLHDARGTTFASKTVPSINIGGTLNPYEGRRIFFRFQTKEYSLSGIDTSSIHWDYGYHLL